MSVEAMKPTRVSESKPDPFVGRTVDGYRIDELIGRGGMGEVYLATQLSLNRPVALKVLPHALLEDQRFLDRFRREVDILSRLSHPGIVTVMERGEVDGRPYVVMEYVRGTSLREVMKRGPVSTSEALVIVRGVLSALEHAHTQGIIHRDIKPENVLIAPGGVVKVADFGLSRLMEPDITRLTRSHVMLGTFEYMAPEQREQAKDADERSDLYATGVVLYEMIAGELPIGHFDPLSKTRPKECDGRIDEIVKRSLQKRPDARYQKAASMGNAVSQLLSAPALVEAPAPAPAAAEAVVSPPTPDLSWHQYRVYAILLAGMVLAYAITWSMIIVAALAIAAFKIPWHKIRRKHAILVGTVALLGFAGVFKMVNMKQRNARGAATQQRLDAMRAANRPVKVLVAFLRPGKTLEPGFADALLRDLSVKDWLTRTGRPSWASFPDGISTKTGIGGVYLIFDRLVTKTGHHEETKMNTIERNIAAAFSMVLAARTNYVERILTSNANLERQMRNFPPPKAKPFRTPVARLTGIGNVLPEGTITKILDNEAVLAWIASVAAPMWEYPEGVSVVLQGRTVFVTFDRSVTKSGAGDSPSAAESRVIYAIARALVANENEFFSHATACKLQTTSKSKNDPPVPLVDK